MSEYSATLTWWFLVCGPAAAGIVFLQYIGFHRPATALNWVATFVGLVALAVILVAIGVVALEVCRFRERGWI